MLKKSMYKKYKKIFGLSPHSHCMYFDVHRFISYPRTETNIFPATLPLAPLVEQQTQSQSWGTFAQRVLDQPGGPNPRQGKNSDQAHPPIHPTKFTSSLEVTFMHRLTLFSDTCCLPLGYTT